MLYVAYRDTNKHIHVKSASSMQFAQEMIDQCADATNVDDFIMPYSADSRRQAEQIARERLSLNRPVFREA